MIMSVNWWAIVVSALAALAIGSFWHGPLFGQQWIRAMGWDKVDKAQQEAMRRGMGMAYFWQFIASGVMAYVLALFIGRLGMWGFTGGVTVAFWAWLGFVLTIKFGDSLWGGKKELFWMSSGNMLLTMLVMGAILGAWK